MKDTVLWILIIILAIVVTGLMLISECPVCGEITTNLSGYCNAHNELIIK